MSAPGAYIFGCSAHELSAGEAAFFRESDPWGFILFARNIDSGEQTSRLTAALRGTVGRDAPVLIDQEGGRVQRYRAPVGRNWPPPIDHAALGARAIWIRNRLIADELAVMGIDVNCTPCADIARQDTHPFLKNRCYGTDAAAVTELARAAADGLTAGGVLPVIKHMPGHGRSQVDSHLDLPEVSASVGALRESDFAPFQALADLPIGMTAHVRFSAIDADAPATHSLRMIEVIRNEIGFDGLLLTDDLSMEALGGAIEMRAKKALDAGCDIALHCNGEMGEMEAVAALCGTMTTGAETRAEAALVRRGRPAPIDIAALEAELLALSGDT